MPEYADRKALQVTSPHTTVYPYQAVVYRRIVVPEDDDGKMFGQINTR